MTDLRSTNNVHPQEHSLTSHFYRALFDETTQQMLKHNNRLWEKVLVN